MRALGIDLGSKRIGVALSDPGGILASPVTAMARTGDRAGDHRAIAGLVAEHGAEVVVVGHPIDLEGRRGPAARSVEAEVAELEKVLTVPVVLHDERLTTVVADRSLRERGLDGRQRRRTVDQVAAAVLLQSWLDRR